MSKITKDELIESMNEVENILMSVLNLKENLTDLELAEFYTCFIPFLNHGRKNELLDRSTDTIKSKLIIFYNFAKNIGLTDREIINFLKEYPSVLNVAGSQKFIDKYILLSVIENEDNTVRKRHMITRPKDFRVSLETIYARYALMRNLGYDKINWSMLVKKTHDSFISRFVINGGEDKSYKVFNDVKDMSADKLRELYPVDYSFIEELRNCEVNSFGGFDGKSMGK